MDKGEIIQTKVAERREGGVTVCLYAVFDIGENTREWYCVEWDGPAKSMMRKYSMLKGAVMAYRMPV